MAELTNAAVLAALGAFRVSRAYVLDRLVYARLNDIANRNHFNIRVPEKLTKMSKALLSDPDKAKRNSIGRSLSVG